MELRRRGRAAAAACGILTAMGCLGGAGPVHAAGSGPLAAGFSTPGGLEYVSADSPKDAWAVGGGNGPTPIVAHWNGSKWSATPIPKVRYADLKGVAAVSPTDAWLVGFDDDPTTISNYEMALVLHWNGKGWKRIEIPLFAGDFPWAVAATAKSVWIFGSSQIWHLSDGTWNLVPASKPVNGGLANGVAVAWPGTFWWGGGSYQPATGPETSYVIRWNGIAWKRVAIPMDRPNDYIEAMAGGPHGAVWAVGWGSPDGDGAQFATGMLWNGKKWRRVELNAESDFEGVSFIRGGGAWAVGSINNGDFVLAARWTGSAWQQVPVPVPPASTARECNLTAVSATSARDAWAVGSCWNTGLTKTSTWIVHWNGKAWS
jgi:hypothetical protein